jgi:hypothetical protein
VQLVEGPREESEAEAIRQSNEIKLTFSKAGAIEAYQRANAVHRPRL